MTAINVQLPDSVAKKAGELAAKDGVSFDQFISAAVAEKISGWLTEDDLDKPQIHNSILWTSKPKFRGSFLYRTSNYHKGDFNLFYLNVRENVATRISSFWK